MAWTVVLHPDFDPEFQELTGEVQDELLAEFGPRLGRPHADTLAGSKHANMKELRCNAEGGVWRVAFAFDPQRKGIVLVAGDKSGVSQARFYKSLITKADHRFDEWLEAVPPKKKGR